MKRRALAFSPPVGLPGRRVDLEPVRDSDHFFKCAECGHLIDMRDLGEVFEHEGPHDAPLTN